MQIKSKHSALVVHTLGNGKGLSTRCGTKIKHCIVLLRIKSRTTKLARKILNVYPALFVSLSMLHRSCTAYPYAIRKDGQPFKGNALLSEHIQCAFKRIKDRVHSCGDRCLSHRGFQHFKADDLAIFPCPLLRQPYRCGVFYRKLLGGISALWKLFVVSYKLP